MDQNHDSLFDGRYRLIDILGSGTSALVHRAIDTETGTEVALKIFDEERMLDEEAKRQFDHEVKAFALLDSHPNIVSYFGGSMREGCRYIVMELAVGETLMHYMNLKGGRLPTDEALSYFSQILSALSHAHGKGIIHRDVKPQNVRLVSGGLVKLVDFGIALIPGFETTASGKAVGTVNYISPEQAAGGRVDARSDLYSAGVLLYEMLCGQLPFQSDKKNPYDRMDEIIRKHLKETPVKPSFFNPNIPTAVEQIVLRAMNKNPAKRFESADEMLRYIRLYYDDPRICFDFDLPSDPYNAYDALSEDTDAGRFIPSALLFVGQVKEGEAPPKAEEEAKPPKRRTTLFLTGVFVALLSVFLLVGVLAVNRLFFYDASEKSVITVGELCNQPYNDDLAQYLAEKGYEVDIEYAYHGSIPLNTIISQDPPAQSVQRLSANEKPKLKLTISGGCRIMIMPDYKGKEYRSVEIELEGQDFETEKVYQASQLPAGQIIATAPSAGETAIQNEPIVLYISSGEEVVYQQVPSLVGLSATEAVSLLEQVGIRLSGISYEESDHPAGTVIAQSHRFGETIAIDYTAVGIVVSRT